MLRRAAQVAASVRGELIGVHVREPSGLAAAEQAWLVGQAPAAGRAGRPL